MSRRRALLLDATSRLEAAGVASPSADAEILLAHVLGTSRTALVLVENVEDDHAAAYDLLVTRRARREPLQHLTGTLRFRHVDLVVGPGVFVPRPETELLAGWAVDRARERESPVVVDLCTGSGAIAAAVRHEVADAEVHAVELSAEALDYARLNLSGVDLRHGDAFEAFEDLLGAVDIVVCNPPYVPLEAWESVAPEARDHDPHLALFSGDDGLDAIRVLAVRAAALLAPGGLLGVEHADVQGESVPALLAATGRWAEIRDHRDLAGRARFTTARLAR